MTTSVTRVPTIDISQFDAAIFDLDGVVTKTARVHAAAWKKLFDEFLKDWAVRHGHPFRPFDLVQDYRPYVDGKPRNDGVKSFLDSRNISIPYGSQDDRLDQETICSLGNRKNALFLDTLNTQGVEPYLATVEFIRMLRTQRKKTAIVTASKNCVEVLEAANLTDLFDVKVDGHDAEQANLRGKPAPDVFLKAAELLDVSPKRGIVFEDALAGVHAGHEGNFGTVVGVDRANQSAAIVTAGADIVISDLVELVLCNKEEILCQSVRSLPSAFVHVEKLVNEIKMKRLAIFLDYDGTLTPIVKRPELAILSDRMRETLQALADTWTVGIISGRDREDVERLVNIDSLHYAGSHGFDIAGPQGLNIQYEVGKQFLPSLDQAERLLQKHLGTVPGALIERKKYSVAVHFRLVAPQDCPRVNEIVNHVLSAQLDLRKTSGKKVYELQPRVDWNKGKALMWLLHALDLSMDQTFPIYLGDDLTDEDAFSALKGRGIGIIVDDSFRFTAAQYMLHHPTEVQKFLDHLLHAGRGAS